MYFLPIEERGLKNYAGFWKRFGAGIIDIIVLIPFIFIFFYLESLSIIATYISVIISSSLYVTYTIYFHYRFGATLGKMEKKLKSHFQTAKLSDLSKQYSAHQLTLYLLPVQSQLK